MSAIETVRQTALSSTFWIDFDEARNAVETIVEVAHDDPEERPTCIVLTGQSGMGKTSILREAQRRLTEALPEPAGWGEARYQPVLRTVIPSSPTSLKINLALLWKQGWPIRTNTHKTADFKVVDLLAAQGTRLVAIDNVHVILTASGVARRDTLDAFRFLMSAGNVPLVVAGLDVARQIFADDVELAFRSIMLNLPLWEPGEPSQRLIRALARGMDMAEPDHLAEPAFAERIWRESGGVTGNFKRILHWSGKVAKRHDRVLVTHDDISQALQLFTPYSPEWGPEWAEARSSRWPTGSGPWRVNALNLGCSASPCGMKPRARRCSAISGSREPSLRVTWPHQPMAPQSGTGSWSSGWPGPRHCPRRQF